MKDEKQYYVDLIASTMERTVKRLWIVIILLIVLLVGTNAMWVYYESQFADEVVETYTAETDSGGTAIVNRDGEVNYGESDLHQNNEKSP